MLRWWIILSILSVTSCVRFSSAPGGRDLSDSDSRTEREHDTYPLLADASPDSTHDASPDSTHDASLDSTHDASPDSTHDASSDSAVDSGPPADSGSPSTCSSAVGLELCVSFSNISGTTVLDESGNGHDGVMLGSAQVVSTGKVGSAVQFSGGPGDTLDFGKILGTFSDLTVTAWFKFNSPPVAWQSVLGRWENFKGYWLGTSNSSGGFEWWINNSVAKTTVPVTGWTHVAGTLNLSDRILKLYVNGVLADSQPFHGTLETATTVPLETGGGGGSTGVPLDGLVDELRIWSVTRTQHEICTDAGGTPTANDGCTL